MTGKALCRLMRVHKVTIRTMAQRLGIPMTRVRSRRQHGLPTAAHVRDWVEAITGTDPGAHYPGETA
jgi:hypothetical protein